ncbi:MAG: hypothetical protein NVS9B10_00720 [Nevskia sp.]
MLTLAASLVLAACANQAAEDAPSSLVSDAAPVVPDSVYTGWLAAFKHCREKFAEIDKRIDAAGVRDATYYRVPGFPYFRTDRTLASFRNEVHSVDEIGGWTRRMREFDQESREFELDNLGLTQQERAIWRFDLLGCGRGLASIELEDPAVMKRLLASVVPPPDYPATAPVAMPDPKLRARVLARQQQIAQEFARPLASLDAPGPLLLWQIKPKQDMSLIEKGYGSVILDELGFPGLIDSAWAALAERNAPRLWIETSGESDRPGTPKWAGALPDVDLDRPEVHYQITFTRFGTQRLPQINYLFWFKGCGKAEGGGPAKVDGFIWRVTLDAKAQPLVYESLHLSGRDHEWFPAQPLPLKTATAAMDVPALIPQKDIPAGAPVLRIQAGTHALRRLVSLNEAAHAEVREFDLRRYEDLTSLPKPDGSKRSLFGPDGVVPGAHDADPFWTWGTGISHPGGLRQLGHHASDYTSRRQFDDPFLLESVFVAPTALPAAPAS